MGADDRLSGNFEADLTLLDATLRIDESFDLVRRELTLADRAAALYYIDGFVKAEMMQKLLVHLIGLKELGDGSSSSAAAAARCAVPSVEIEISDSLERIVFSVMSGCCVLLSACTGKDALIIDARTYPTRSMSEPENDRVLRGSRDGFVETLIFNTAMLRRRIRDTALTVKYINGGRRTHTDMALCYMSDSADMKYVASLQRRLESLNTDSLVLGHQSIAESLIRDSWYNPFPKIRSTERPDAACATLLEGGIILLCDNSPEAMIFPSSILDFLQETDDYYFPPLTGSYLRIVRHLIFWLTMLLTPLWYLALRHAPQLPNALYFIVPREVGEIPIIAQLFLTEFAIDGLKLASLNTPSMLSNSLSVVGGLLLGDFAVGVGWLAPDVILYTAFTAIAHFTQQSYELGYAFKFMRLLLLLLTALFDWVGFLLGLALAVFLIATNKTVNGKRNYLYPLIPFNGQALARLLLRLKKRN